MWPSPLPTIVSDIQAKILLSYNLRDWLENLKSSRGQTLLQIYSAYEDLLNTSPASSHNHQTWPGGLADHLADMCRFGYIMYQGDKALYGEPEYTWESFVVAVFCHDAEKFVVYGQPTDPRCAPFHALADTPANKQEKEGIKWEVLEYWRKQFGLTLTYAETNAVKYAHGEGDDYRSNQRVMLPLAAALGNADRHSARIRFNKGQNLG